MMRLSVVISVVMVHGDVRHFEEAKGYELFRVEGWRN